MSYQKRPHVTINPPANHYSAPHERIIEFSVLDKDAGLIGGLIGLRHYEGRLVLDVYRCDPGVEVHTSLNIPTNEPTSVGAQP